MLELVAAAEVTLRASISHWIVISLHSRQTRRVDSLRLCHCSRIGRFTHHVRGSSIVWRHGINNSDQNITTAPIIRLPLLDCSLMKIEKTWETSLADETNIKTEYFGGPTATSLAYSTKNGLQCTTIVVEGKIVFNFHRINFHYQLSAPVDSTNAYNASGAVVIVVLGPFDKSAEAC